MGCGVQNAKATPTHSLVGWVGGRRDCVRCGQGWGLW